VLRNAFLPADFAELRFCFFGSAGQCGNSGLVRRARTWGDENSHIEALNFYLIFIPFLGRQVSGVGVQDRLLRLTFLTPETSYETTPKWHGFLMIELAGLAAGFNSEPQNFE
jgi:hypothetical protein